MTMTLAREVFFAACLVLSIGVIQTHSKTHLADALARSDWTPRHNKRMLDSIGSSLIKKRWGTAETAEQSPSSDKRSLDRVGSSLIRKRMLDTVGSSLIKKRWGTAETAEQSPPSDKRSLDRVGSSLIRKRMLDTIGSSLIKKRVPQSKRMLDSVGSSLLRKRMLDPIGSALLKRAGVASTESDVRLNKRLLDSEGSSLLMKRRLGWNDNSIDDDAWSKRIWHTSSVDRVGSSLLKRNEPRQLDEIMDGAIGRDTDTTLDNLQDA